MLLLVFVPSNITKIDLDKNKMKVTETCKILMYIYIYMMYSCIVTY